MLTAQPIATSSIRVRPTFQPVGSMMLNRMITTNVKPACPAANEMTAGAAPEMSTAGGSRTHSNAVWSETPIMMAEPTTNPTAVPATARRAVAPVPSALVRSTESVPSTTQNPCETPVTSTTATASASPAAPRIALRNHTECKDSCDENRRQNVRGAESRPVPSLWSIDVSAPAAASVASATISVMMPRVRTWRPGSSIDAKWAGSTSCSSEKARLLGPTLFVVNLEQAGELGVPSALRRSPRAAPPRRAGGARRWGRRRGGLSRRR